MSNLIRNELTKIFKKKSIYIILLITLAFVILINCTYKFFYNNDTYYMSENYINYIKEDLKHLDPNKASDQNTYIELSTEVEVYELSLKYDKDAWQQEVIQEQIKNNITEINTYKYGIEKNIEKQKEAEEEYNTLVQKLDNNDWKYFAEKSRKSTKEELESAKEEKASTEDKMKLEQIESNIKTLELKLEVLDKRIEKDICYGNDYRNQALQKYQSSGISIENFKNEKELNYEEKQEYYNSIKNYHISKYIIDTQQDVLKENDLRGILMNIFDEFELFIVVLIIMIAGVIVSEEFNKGTIKLLLVRPYSRVKILLAKYITTIIIVIFAMIMVVLMELLVGGILFGFGSLQVPVVQYDFNLNELVTMNPIYYLLIQAVSKLPLYILLATIAFCISTIFSNSAVGITIGLLGYMSTEIINMLVLSYNIKFMHYFITMHWNISQYLFGELPQLEGMTCSISLAVCLVYLLVMLIPTFIIFKKKNIKNI